MDFEFKHGEELDRSTYGNLPTTNQTGLSCCLGSVYRPGHSRTEPSPDSLLRPVCTLSEDTGNIKVIISLTVLIKLFSPRLISNLGIFPVIV